MSGLLPSTSTTLPKPKRSCSTSIPTCKPLVSEGANPAVGVWAFGKMEVVLTSLGLGLEKVSFCCQAILSELNPILSSAIGTLGLKSSSRHEGFSSSKKRLGSQLLSVPHLYREVA